MLQAKVDHKLITAGPEAPEWATCPACEGQVQKRRRSRGRGKYTWYFRHANAVGPDCPLRGPGMGRVG
jgi:hypothetical protein